MSRYFYDICETYTCTIHHIIFIPTFSLYSKFCRYNYDNRASLRSKWNFKVFRITHIIYYTEGVQILSWATVSYKENSKWKLMPKFETICLISIGRFKTNFPDRNGRDHLFNRKVGHSRVFCTLAKNTGELLGARAKEGQDEESPTGGLNWVRFLSDTETPSVTLWLVENLCQPSLKSLFRR